LIEKSNETFDDVTVLEDAEMEVKEIVDFLKSSVFNFNK